MKNLKLKEKIEYIVVCISEFARRYKLSLPQAFSYLKRHQGIDYLDKFYDVEHLFSLEDAVDDVAAICRKNGGQLV